MGGRSLTAEKVRKLLSAPDYGLSWGQLSRFANITFKEAGTFKVCACDSSLGPCQTPADYTVEVGKAHASGLQCLLGQPQFARGECVSQYYGGLRCYPDEAPQLDLPYNFLRVPDGSTETTIFGANQQTVMALTSFCLYGSEERREFEFCNGIAPTR